MHLPFYATEDGRSAATQGHPLEKCIKRESKEPERSDMAIRGFNRLTANDPADR